ncbi:MAG: SufD family Fe-S cluster assembly protein [Alistipes sp.]|nr:SufD family Fe-S cluster assembly protein [Alistipes sp.]
MLFLEYLESIGLESLASGQEIEFAGGERATLLFNPTKVTCGVAEQGEESIVVVYTDAEESCLKFDLMPYSKLRLHEVYLGKAKVECRIRQQVGSVCDITSIVVGSSEVDYNIDLDGREASNVLRSAFIVGGEEHSKVGVRVNHNEADCSSNSLVKGVAGGKAVGEFHGMVYVAEGAQHTDARQSSRNIEIGADAKIITKPQLEIYADDVKCSHGATVGQLDGEAIFYMRQRGLSEKQARRVQIEGFVREVVLSSPELGEAMAEELTHKLEML